MVMCCAGSTQLWQRFMTSSRDSKSNNDVAGLLHHFLAVNGCTSSALSMCSVIFTKLLGLLGQSSLKTDLKILRGRPDLFFGMNICTTGKPELHTCMAGLLSTA